MSARCEKKQQAGACAGTCPIIKLHAYRESAHETIWKQLFEKGGFVETVADLLPETEEMAAQFSESIATIRELPLGSKAAEILEPYAQALENTNLGAFAAVLRDGVAEQIDGVLALRPEALPDNLEGACSRGTETRVDENGTTSLYCGSTALAGTSWANTGMKVTPES